MYFAVLCDKYECYITHEKASIFSFSSPSLISFRDLSGLAISAGTCPLHYLANATGIDRALPRACVHVRAKRKVVAVIAFFRTVKSGTHLYADAMRHPTMSQGKKEAFDDPRRNKNEKSRATFQQGGHDAHDVYSENMHEGCDGDARRRRG